MENKLAEYLKTFPEMVNHECSGYDFNMCSDNHSHGSVPCAHCKTRLQRNFLTERKHFEVLKPKDKIYKISRDSIQSYYYAGFNPASENLIMLVSTANIETIINIYIPNLLTESSARFVLDYELAKQIMLENAIKNVDVIKEIYFNKYK